jgi:hypothetical protein
MSKVTLIHAGYRLSVTTWENDADNYKIKIVEGLTKPQVSFLVDVCNHMESASNGGFANNQFGNLYEPTDGELELYSRYMLALAKAHGYDCDPDQDYDDMYDLYDAADEAIYELSGYELSDLGLTGDDFFTRVCESYTVEYIPQAVELQDVTADFKGLV